MVMTRKQLRITLSYDTFRRLKLSGRRMSHVVEEALNYYWSGKRPDADSTQDLQQAKLLYYAMKKDGTLTRLHAFELWKKFSTVDIKEYNELTKEIEEYILAKPEKQGKDETKVKNVNQCPICMHSRDALISRNECSCPCHRS